MNTSAGLARRLATNTAHAAVGRIISILVWVILTPLLLNGLGKEGYAVWALFFALTGYLGALDFGLAQATLKHVAAARARLEDTSGGAFATLAVLAYLGLGALWLVLMLSFRDPLLDWLRVSPGLRAAADQVVLLGAPVFACAGLANVAIAVLQGSGRFDLANIVLLTVVGAQAVGVPIVLRAHLGIQGLAINLAFAWALGFVLGISLIRMAEPGFRWQGPRASRVHLREAFRFGGPMQLTNFFGVLNLQLDKFLLARFVALEAVTAYELGFRVIAAAAAVPQVMVAALLPAAAAIHAEGQSDRLYELYERANRYVLVAAACTMAALIGAAPRLYSAWLGPGHDDAAFALRGLAVATAVSIASVASVIMARAVSRTDLEAWFSVVTFAIHLPLSLILLPGYGMGGALSANIVSNLIGSGMMLLLMSRALGWSPGRVLREPLGIPLIAGVLGILVGLAADRLLPSGHGPTAGIWLGAVAGTGAMGSLVTALLARFIRLSEVRAIVLGQPARTG